VHRGDGLACRQCELNFASAGGPTLWSERSYFSFVQLVGAVDLSPGGRACSAVKDDHYACGHHRRTHQNNCCAAKKIGHSNLPKAGKLMPGYYSNLGNSVSELPHFCPILLQCEFGRAGQSVPPIPLTCEMENARKPLKPSQTAAHSDALVRHNSPWVLTMCLLAAGSHCC
jgi:hypothetical protein